MNTPKVVWELYRNEAEPEQDIPSRGPCLLPEVPSLGWCKSHHALPGGERSYGIPSYELVLQRDFDKTVPEGQR